jgi:hypothetical protein
MPPATRSAEREEERRLNTRTLTIASVASATAAGVTSQLWIAGTWIAAALTPVLVTLLSEALHRPTERIARAWTSDRPALGAQPARREEPVAPPHGDPLQPRGTVAGPVRVYRQPTDGKPRRRFALRALVATAAVAFVVAVATVTAGDLLSGGSIGRGGSRTTLFGGHAKKQQPQQQQDVAPSGAKPEQAPSSTGESPPATDTAPEPPQPDTAPVAPPTDPPAGEPAPDALP